MEQIDTKILNSNQLAILDMLAYFHSFNYPCTLQEIFAKSKISLNQLELQNELHLLLEYNVLIEKEGYYTLNIDGVNERITKRKSGNENSKHALKKAQQYTKLISKFPFVRGVYLSGSLSKGVFDADSDVDYFIITAPKRLWICRSLLILFKKIFLLNSRKYFCVNYFIDDMSLNLPDHNLFVATEITHLIPTYNYPLYLKVLAQNKWIEEYYPNYHKNSGDSCIETSSSKLKKGMEIILEGNFGEKLDNFFFRITLSRWKKKFNHLRDEDFDIQMRTKKNVSKHHPGGHQKIVLEKQEQILKQIIIKHNLSFTL